LQEGVYQHGFKTFSMPYLKTLTREINEMWMLVLSQHQKACTALLSVDKDLAREIILVEERVNSCQQFIENDCENYFSLPSMQADSIPHAMYILKMSRQLETVGDLAKKIATDILGVPSIFEEALLHKSKLPELFAKSNQLLEMSFAAFGENNSALASIIIGRTEVFQELISENGNTMIDYTRQFPYHRNQVLHVFSVIESLRRTVEMSANIAEGIINYAQKTTDVPQVRKAAS
jgi:phosphate transport system protein